MKDYRIKKAVALHDVDFNSVARTSAILQYLQSAAEAQLTENGMSYDSLKDRRRAFILSKIRLEVTAPLHVGAPISVITFPSDSRGYTFLRCFALECGGEVVARAASLWALIDTGSRSLVRVEDFNLGLPTLPPIDLIPKRIKLPDNMSAVGEYVVRYSDIDRNEHMNNTKYLDVYSHFLPMENRMIKEVTVSYMNEAKMCDALTVLRGEYGGAYYFRTLLPDGRVNSEAEITVREL